MFKKKFDYLLTFCTDSQKVKFTELYDNSTTLQGIELIALLQDHFDIPELTNEQLVSNLFK